MTSYMIVGGTITQATNDKQQLKPVLDQIKGLPDQLGTMTWPLMPVARTM
jgi:hypothetical protein